MFVGFGEMPITFPPTYKLVKSVYCSNRKPGWTDRILFKSELECRPIQYQCIPHIDYSDHLPVFMQAVLDVGEQGSTTPPIERENLGSANHYRY